MTITIRDCEAADLPATVAIFNELIPTTTIAWTDVLITVEDRHLWWERHRARNFPVLVAIDAATEVVGMASYSDFRNTPSFEGYRFSVEHSVHVRGDQRGNGIGRMLLDALLVRAREAGLHVMIGAIDADNTDSLRFHERMGFTEVDADARGRMETRPVARPRPRPADGLVTPAGVTSG